MRIDPLGIVSACQGVLERATHVKLNQEAVRGASNLLKDLDWSGPRWDPEFHYQGDPKKVLAYVFIVDALNFCFWSFKDQKRWEFIYKGKVLDGYHALAACLRVLFEKGIPLWEPEFLSSLEPVSFFSMFSAMGALNLMHRRLENLLELGKVVRDKFDGSFERIIDLAHGSAVRLVQIMAENFPSFSDVAGYKGSTVPFYKRAQLLAWDLSIAFGGKGYGQFGDLDLLTCFADYKLPQVLRELGVLVYSKELSDIVDNEITIAQGSPMEVEIRAGTVVAVELLREELQGMGRSVRSADIDYVLWNLGQQEQYKKRPYHKTVTIFY
jgi:hypothetical protein